MMMSNYDIVGICIWSMLACWNEAQRLLPLVYVSISFLYAIDRFIKIMFLHFASSISVVISTLTTGPDSAGLPAEDRIRESGPAVPWERLHHSGTGLQQEDNFGQSKFLSNRWSLLFIIWIPCGCYRGNHYSRYSIVQTLRLLFLSNSFLRITLLRFSSIFSTTTWIKKYFLKYPIYLKYPQMPFVFMCGPDATGLPARGPWRQGSGGQRERKSTATCVSPAGWGAAPAGEESSPEDQGTNGRGRQWRGRVRRSSSVLPSRQAHEPAQHGCAVRGGVQPLPRLSVLLQLWVFKAFSTLNDFFRHL